MVKTFPIVMDDTFHKRLAGAAAKTGKSIKDLVLDTLAEKIIEIEKE
jgi:predicted HicB family RNase H-like nuclease